MKRQVLWERLAGWREAFTLHRMRASPERVARSFAIGILIGMLPGTGVAAAVAVAVIARLHKPAVILGALINNPWTTPFFYVISYQLGKRVTGFESQVEWHGWSSWRHPAWWAGMPRLLWPTVLGTLIVGVVLGLAGYGLVYGLLRMRRRRTGAAGRIRR